VTDCITTCPRCHGQPRPPWADPCGLCNGKGVLVTDPTTGKPFEFGPLVLWAWDVKVEASVEFNYSIGD
jgi:hypothetical protein